METMHFLGLIRVWQRNLLKCDIFQSKILVTMNSLLLTVAGKFLYAYIKAIMLLWFVVKVLDYLGLDSENW